MGSKIKQFDKTLRPRGAVGVYVLNKKNQLLLLLRNSSHQGGMWCAPGGHIEYGESFEDTAIREAKEECGINVKKIAFLNATSDVYDSEKKHYIGIHLKAVAYTGIPKLTEPDNFFEIKWFDLNNLPTNLLPGNKHFFEQNPMCLCGSGKKHTSCHGK